MRVTKQLSANDLGLTGAHQAGILVPKEPEMLAFFPTLSPEVKNPRLKIPMKEVSTGARWEFNYIYYNNKHFDVGGTRNEYRLTGMTAFFRATGASEGDALEFSKDTNDSFRVRLLPAGKEPQPLHSENVLVLRSGWLIIKK